MYPYTYISIWLVIILSCFSYRSSGSEKTGWKNTESAANDSNKNRSMTSAEIGSSKHRSCSVVRFVRCSAAVRSC